MPRVDRELLSAKYRSRRQCHRYWLWLRHPKYRSVSKLGARQALGVDIDLDAVNAARENAELNQVSEQFSIGLGSVNEVRIGEYSIQRSGLVLANILAPVLVQLLDNRLGDLVLPGGWLILSGILKDQATQVEEALQRHGLILHSRRFIDDWVALAAKR